MPGLGEYAAKIDRLSEQLDALNTALREFPRNEQQHAPAYREWERFVLTDGGVCIGGAVTIGGFGSNLRPAPNGWEAEVRSIAITASGASSAATVVVYNGQLADPNLTDYANAMLGNSPSRLVAFYDPEVFYCEQSDELNIVLAGAAATSVVTVRVAGVRRML